MLHPHGLHLSKCFVCGEDRQSSPPATSLSCSFGHSLDFIATVCQQPWSEATHTFLVFVQHCKVQRCWVGTRGCPISHSTCSAQQLRTQLFHRHQALQRGPCSVLEPLTSRLLGRSAYSVHHLKSSGSETSLFGM